MGTNMLDSMSWKFMKVFIYLYLITQATIAERTLVGIKQKSSNEPNNCIYEYNEDANVTTAPCSSYITMMMGGYILDENSVPIVAMFNNSELAFSKQQSASMQKYVNDGKNLPTCKFILKQIVRLENCCAGYSNFPSCNSSVCYSDRGGCLNGGVCNSPNLCTCPPKYAGIQCDEDALPVINENHPALLYCYQNSQCYSFKKANQTGVAMSFRDCCKDKVGSWGSANNMCQPCQSTASQSTSNSNLGNFTTCHSYGMDFYRTFDGQLFNFQGRCSYTLVTPRSSTSSSWTISVAFSKCESQDRCSKRVMIVGGNLNLVSDDVGLYYSTGVAGKYNLLKVDNTDSALTVPGTSAFVFRQDNYVILALEAGNIKVKWDNNTNIYVSIHSSIYTGDLTGLCGNADNNPSNDFGKADNVASFGNSFKGNSCPDVVNKAIVCKNTADKSLAVQQCSKIRVKFPQCADLENADLYYQMCVQSVCSLSTQTNVSLTLASISKSLCTHLSAYAETCAEKGSCIQWRSDTLCEKKCPGRKIWSDCTSECARTCRNLFQMPSSYCHGTKVGRCTCPPGEVEYENDCIQPSECPCLYDGKVHPPGSTRQFDCNTCTCKSALWECTTKSCPAICQIMGTQFNTFDGAKYSFNDLGCRYRVMGPKPGVTDDRAKVVVDVQTNVDNLVNPKDTSVFLNLPKVIYISYAGSEIYFKANSPMIGESQTNVFIDGIDFTTKLPYNDTMRDIQISKITNIYILLKIGSHFKLYFDGSKSAYIKASSALKNQIYGLCGKYDGNSENDFTEKSSEIRESIVNIVKSYLIGRCDYKPAILIDPPFKDNDICTKILNGPEFSACMNSSKVDKAYFGAYCRRENSCTCSKTSSSYCSAILNAAIECRKFGPQYEVDFTSELLKACIPQCQSGGTVFQFCARTCQSTCREIGRQSATVCDDECFPGCDCQPGYFKTGSGQCVTKSECTCFNPSKPDDPDVAAGTVIETNCQSCVCTDGVFNCSIIESCQNPTCPKNQKYLKQISKCNTCADVDSCSTDDLIYNSCACPKGTYSKLDGTCVEPNDCPCTYMSQEYAPDSIIAIRCAKYKCKNRQWKLISEETGNCEAVCIAYGDPHYFTFDGQMFSFQGSCSYTMMQSQGNSVDNFPPITISVANIACGYNQVTCTKFVQIVIGDQTYVLTRGTNDTIPSNPNFGVVMERSTLFTQLVAESLGLRVMWDRSTRVYIFVKPHFQNKVQGLCGNYDGDVQNEYMHGTMKYEDAIQFAQSFITNADICPMEVSPETTPGSTKEQDMCNANPERAEWAEQMCGIMKDPNGVFKSCIEAMHQDVNSYYGNCLYDACGCNRGGDCECLCTSLATFATQCALLGSPVKWRSQTLCPIMCEGGKRYDTCMEPCAQNCEARGPNPPSHCQTTHCIEGCACPEGMIEENGECVLPASCPCFHDGKPYTNATGYYTDDCRRCDCINNAFQCFEDYTNCTSTCSPEQFRCNNGKCLNDTQRCDGNVDCEDKEDETDCKPKTCDPHEFICVSSGQCLPESKRCDGTPHCSDKSDEESCKCLAHQITCNVSKICLDESKRCDGSIDCGKDDNSDEENCPTTISPKPCTTTNGMTDNTIIGPENVVIQVDSASSEITDINELGSTPGLEVKGKNIIIHVDLTKAETQTAILTKLEVDISDTNEVENYQVTLDTAVGPLEKTISGGDLISHPNIIELLGQSLPTMTLINSFTVTITTKSEPNKETPSIRVTISAIGCFSPKQLTGQTTRRKTEPPTGTTPRVTAPPTGTTPRVTVPPTGITTSQPCTSTNGMKDNIIRPEDVSIQVDSTPQDVTDIKKLGETPGLPLKGNEITITVDLVKQGTQTSVLTELVVNVENTNNVDKVTVLVTPVSGSPVDTVIPGTDLPNSPNIIQILEINKGELTPLQSVTITIITKPEPNGEAPEVSVTISAIGCFTPKELTGQTTPRETAPPTGATSQSIPLTTGPQSSSTGLQTTTNLIENCRNDEIMCESLNGEMICAKLCDRKAECKNPLLDEPVNCQETSAGLSTYVTEITTGSTAFTTPFTEMVTTSIGVLSTTKISTEAITTMEVCSDWSDWSNCNVSCGLGSRTRFRNCSQLKEESSQCYGIDCHCFVSFSDIKHLVNRDVVSAWIEVDDQPGLTNSSESIADGQMIEDNVVVFFVCGNCTCSDGKMNCLSDETCKKDCEWSTWNEWSDCTGTCDRSTRKRDRVIGRLPFFGGKDCEPNGNEEIEACPNTCICEWSAWSPWTPCSKPCGSGTTTKTRTPLNSACSDSAESAELTVTCNDFPCVNETTTHVCDKNKELIICHNVSCPRTCEDVQTGGIGCEESADCVTGCFCHEDLVMDRDGNCVKPDTCCDITQANCKECEIGTCENGKAVCKPSENCDCSWNIWQEWSPCNKACGESSKSRTRSIKTDQRGNGKPCDGTDSEMEVCDFVPCTNCTDNVTGEITMSGSPMTPNNTCEQCFCNYVGQKECNEKPDANKPQPNWNDWSPWSICSGNCPNGTRSRERICIDPCKPISTRCEGNHIETENCEMKCEIDCETGEWRNVTTCNAVCCEDKPISYGIVEQVRDIITPPVNSPNVCETNRTIICEVKCPVNCKVLTYQTSECMKLCAADDSTCDPTCGNGLVTKIPQNVVKAENGGLECNTVYEPCSLGNCSTCLSPKRILKCVNPCEQRCRDLSKPCVDVDCVETCACPNNMLEQDGDCVPKSECRCAWNEDLLGPIPDDYQEESMPNTVYTKECNNCTCRRGKWVCSSNTCKQDCQWDDWNEVIPCNVTCGKGFQVFDRTILTPAQFGGAECTGPTRKEEECYASTQCCDLNVIFAPMNSYCEMTCDDVINRRHPGRRCPAGCRCQPGYVKNIFDKCVPSVQCFRCEDNGRTWEDGETERDIYSCKLYACARGSMLEYPLEIHNGLPPCSIEDYELVASGQRAVRAEDRCCYLATVTRCDVALTYISELTLQNGDRCTLTNGKFIQTTVCSGGCTSGASIMGVETSENPVTKYNRLTKLLLTDPLGLSKEFVKLQTCTCCLPKQYVVNEPRKYVCVNQRSKETVQGYYIDYKITKCGCGK